MIAGLGTDIVETARIVRMLERYPDAFREHTYTPAEIAEGKRRRDDAAFYAGRWAAKEAAAKALGCGIGKHCSLTDLEVVNGESGAPELRLSGAAAAFAASRGGGRLLVSISHETGYAVAVVIFEQ